jgi:hypothetical protein
MLITEFLDGHSFDPETRRVMGVAPRNGAGSPRTCGSNRPNHRNTRQENHCAREGRHDLFQSVGGKLIGWYLTFGRHDWLAIGEFPNEKAAASAILAAAAWHQPWWADHENPCGRRWQGSTTELHRHWWTGPRRPDRRRSLSVSPPQAGTELEKSATNISGACRAPTPTQRCVYFTTQIDAGSDLRRTRR